MSKERPAGKLKRLKPRLGPRLYGALSLTVLTIGGAAVFAVWAFGGFDASSGVSVTKLPATAITIPPTRTATPTATPRECPPPTASAYDSHVVKTLADIERIGTNIFQLIANWNTVSKNLEQMFDAMDALDALADKLDCLSPSPNASSLQKAMNQIATRLRVYVPAATEAIPGSDLDRMRDASGMMRGIISDTREAQTLIGEYQAARATERDRRAGIVTVQGRGTSAERVTLPAGTYEVQVTWSGNSRGRSGTNFAIWLDGAGLRCNLLVNVIGASGSESHFCNLEGGTLRIQVEAASAASWSIRFERD